MTEQEREARNKKRREQYHAKKLASGITIKFPAEPNAFAEKIEDLFESLSPRKEAALKDKGFIWGQEGETLKRMETNLHDSLSTIKGTAETPSRRKFATVIKSIGGKKVDERLRKNFNIHYSTWKKHSLLEFERKKRSDSLSLMLLNYRFSSFIPIMPPLLQEYGELLKVGLQRKYFKEQLKRFTENSARKSGRKFRSANFSPCVQGLYC